MHPLDEKYWSKREYWRWWGYVCPDDPRIVVSKHPRWAGYTLNFGQRRSLPAFLGIVFLMLLPFIACAHFAPNNEVLVFTTLGIMLALLVAVCYRLANPRAWKEKETPNYQTQPIGGKDAAQGQFGRSTNMTTNNIQQFNALTGILLAKLYDTFPKYTEIEQKSFGLDLLDKSDLEGSFAWGDFVIATITWLNDAGYISIEEDSQSNDSISVRLAPKGLELLKSIPQSLNIKEPLGDRLKKFVAARAKDSLQELISQAMSIGLTAIAKIAQQ